MSDEPGRRLPGWLFPAVFTAVVVALGVVALARGDAEPDPATPEGALRVYLQAISERDWDSAFAMLHPEDFAGCEPEDIARATYGEVFTALHRETLLRNGRATVSIDLRFGSGGLFDPTWTNRVDFEMVQRDGLWLVSGDTWPHFRWACQE